MKAVLAIVIVAIAAVGVKGQCNSCRCRTAQGECSASHQYCDESSGTPYCVCESGWSGNDCSTSNSNSQAVVSNPCSPNPCENNSHCQEYNGGPFCTCASGWEGTFCDIKTDSMPCDGITCPAGQTCTNLQVGYVCL